MTANIATPRIVVVPIAPGCHAATLPSVSPGVRADRERVLHPIAATGSEPAGSAETQPETGGAGVRTTGETGPRSAEAKAESVTRGSDDSAPADDPKRARDSIGALHRCQRCDQSIANPHWRSRFCGGRCRVAAHRAARRAREAGGQ